MFRILYACCSLIKKKKKKKWVKKMGELCLLMTLPTTNDMIQSHSMKVSQANSASSSTIAAACQQQVFRTLVRFRAFKISLLTM